MRVMKLGLFGAAGMFLAVSQSVVAEDHIVKGIVTKWEPMVVFAQPGDRIIFTNMAGHDAQAIEGMVPEGTEIWQSKMGAEGFTVTLEKEGVYMYKCNPHVSLGMIGAIVVGDGTPANLATVEGHPDNKGMIGRSVRIMKKELQAKA
jgi:pseudoazurin